MSQQTTIRKLAELVNTPVEKLLEQLAEAGMADTAQQQALAAGVGMMGTALMKLVIIDVPRLSAPVQQQQQPPSK